jgi:hypothetical protein
MPTIFFRVAVGLLLLMLQCETDVMSLSVISNALKSARRISMMSTSFNPDKIARDRTERRAHKNKYSKFATKEVDPLEAAMRKSNDKTSNDKIVAESFNPVRGTTVPMRFVGNSSRQTLSEAANKSDEKVPATPVVNIFFQNQSAIIPSDPFTFGYTQIGTIGSPHGVKSGRKQAGNTYLVKFECVNSRLGAAAFKSYGVFVRLDNRPELKVDEYLVRDLVDMYCYTEVTDKGKDGKTSKKSVLVGQVIGVVPPDELCDPAMAKLMHAMLEIRLAGTDDKLCLIPLVPSIVTSVDVKAMRMIIDPPSGLLDFTYLEKKKKTVIRGFLPERAAHLSKEDRKYLNKVSVLQFPRQ